MEPIYRSARDIFGHAFNAIVKGPAVPAIEIALVFNEKIGGDRMKVAGQHTRFHVRQQPAAHRAIDRMPTPFSVSLRRALRARIGQFVWILWKHWFGKREAFDQHRGWFLSI